jgi:hypothetical protein
MTLEQVAHAHNRGNVSSSAVCIIFVDRKLPPSKSDASARPSVNFINDGQVL